jgi:DNA-binding XRE family transcriptional regulator
MLHPDLHLWHARPGVPQARETMAQRNPTSTLALMTQAQSALGMTQEAFGELIGVSRATIGRWQGGGFGGLIPAHLAIIVRALHDRDPELASQLAASCHATLESLGIIVPPVAPPPKAVPAPHLIDSVVCAAADAVGQLPSALRPALFAAFERASAVGLSMEAVAKGLKGRAAG